jgi:ABC-type uncharacterized transport system permease subunit
MWTNVASPSRAQVRGFARLWLPGFCALLCTSLVWRDGWSPPVLITVVSLAGLCILGATSATAARGLFVGLQILTWPIAIVVSTVALAAVFYLVVTPIGLVLRATGRDPLRLRTRGGSTLWMPSPDERDPERAFRQF